VTRLEVVVLNPARGALEFETAVNIDPSEHDAAGALAYATVKTILRDGLCSPDYLVQLVRDAQAAIATERRVP
jgi:hypothetical protein